MRNDITIHPHERVDDLHRDGHLIIQDPKRFCFGVDAVILSGFARIKKGENVLDLGTGTGIIPILLAAKTEGKHFTGLEIQTESAERANRSVLLNELEERVSIKEGDIKKEYLLPEMIDCLIKEGKAKVDVLETKDTWFGVTYQEDKAAVTEAFANLVKSGVYPSNLYK